MTYDPGFPTMTTVGSPPPPPFNVPAPTGSYVDPSASAFAGASASATGTGTLGNTTAAQKFAAGSGYWVAIGVIGSILISNTKVAPVALGILSVALIYQTGMLIQGK